MPCRQTLFTDERMGDELLPAIKRLAAGSGVVFRHKSLPAAERADLARTVAQLCRKRGLILSVSENVTLAGEVGAELVHKPEGDPGDLPFSLPVHDQGEALGAKERRAALVYVSPVFPTRSHPQTPALGSTRATELALLSGCRAIALGGMNEARFEALDQQVFSGWAGIDAFMR